MASACRSASKRAITSRVLAEACRLELLAGKSYPQVLIRNGKYPLAEEVARTTVSRGHAELAKPGVWIAWFEFDANWGAGSCEGIEPNLQNMPRLSFGIERGRCTESRRKRMLR
jgi:hypothetical protein